MTDREMVTYLHDLARTFSVEKLRKVADRFSELTKMRPFDEYGNYGENNPPVGERSGKEV